MEFKEFFPTQCTCPGVGKKVDRLETRYFRYHRPGRLPKCSGEKHFVSNDTSLHLAMSTMEYLVVKLDVMHFWG